jgi:hypothetical protein
MKKISFLIFFISLILFSSCDSVQDAKKTADEFYTAFNTQDEAKMELLFDEESVINAGIKNDFYNVFNQHIEYFGKVTNYKQTAFSTDISNGNTIVSLKFDCDTEKGTKLYERLKFIKRGNTYKLFQFEYNIDQNKIVD